MNITQLARLPFSGNGAWSELRRLNIRSPASGRPDGFEIAISLPGV